MPDIWIQLENHAWDTVPHRFDRMMGDDYLPTSKLVNLTSPVSGHTRNNVRMYRPVMDGASVGEALIFRRYTANWAAPADQKINPWDLNEPDPTDNGTMGTIPGPVIECNVGDTVRVHFRNMDSRAGKDVKARTHSMHTHGFVFKPSSDGAYPLTPPDPDPINAVGGEAALWALVGVTGPNKQGDRVPPGGTFIYTWNTFGWPSTAGVWLYHDHSICDTENVNLGAIGIVVIHNTADTNNDFLITPADLPDGSLNGSPVSITCFPFDFALSADRVRLLPHDLLGLGLGGDVGDAGGGMHGMDMAAISEKPIGKKTKPAAKESQHAAKIGPPVMERLIRRGDLLLEADAKFAFFRRFCIQNYRTPPSKALYLMLFHEFSGAMAINGRVFLGNTPTMVAGTSTKMRFGVVGMGNNAFHTFHIHGHRWIIPGPDGNNPGTIQNSPQIKAVSQFEDTRIFGPANSFGFTIDGAPGSFMRAGSPSADDAKGEWHMHCHVLGHMMGGMMGSLLIVGGGETAGSLPMGEPCPANTGGGGTGATKEVDAINDNLNATGFSFSPANLTVAMNDTVLFKNLSAGPHSILFTSGALNGTLSPVFGPGQTWSMVMTSMGTFNYECGVHGPPMIGTIVVI